MSAASLSRQQQRAMRRHIADNEATVEADRRFFERHAGRTYRIRRMSPAERAQLETAYDAPVLVTPGCAIFTVVKNLATGVRLRIFVPGPPDEDGNGTSDEIGRFLWDRYVERHPAVAEREAMMLQAMRLPGGPLHEGGAA